MKKKTIRMSLRRKMVLMIFLIAAILSVTTLLASARVIRDMINNHYKEHAEGLSATAAINLREKDLRFVRDTLMEIYQDTPDKVMSDDWGSDAFNAYVARFSGVEDTDSFQALLQQLRAVQEINDADCVYLAAVVPEDQVMMYLVDADLEEPCPPGCLDPIYEVNYEILTNPMRGFPPYITNTEEYGWLATAGVPVVGANGEVIAYCMVDLSMDDIMAQQNRFILITALLLLVLTIVIGIVASAIVDRRVVRPINRMSQAAAKYTGESINEEMREFANLDIHTGDEIEQLADTMKEMEQDVHRYFSNLLSTKAELQVKSDEAETMNKLANMDAMTGVRNKRAFQTQMERLNEWIAAKTGSCKFAIAMVDLNDLKKINDVYGHEKGDETIISLCNTICGVFMHSPVFRVGGDEFVVILEKGDFKRRDRLAELFQKKIFELQSDPMLEPWEQISAAIGYAVYDPELDHSAEEVLHRADEAMYACKKDMKEKKKTDSTPV